VLSIENLDHTYSNGIHALKNVSLDIPKGMFGLLGPNGAGKSSLMRTIATLQQPTSGTIRFDDVDVLAEPDKVRRVLGYLPQHFGVYPRGSAYEMLDHLAVLKGLTDSRTRKQSVTNLLWLTNLYDHRKQAVATYSGGMLKRFGVAQALLGNPRLLVVDEPTAGLDPGERNRFHNMLAEISSDVVIVLSSHFVDDVAVLCPNFAVIAAGRVALRGTPKEVIASLEGTIWEKHVDKSELAVLQAESTVLSYHYSAGRLLIRVQADSCPGRDFEQAAATLEDVYFSVIQAAA
jgi:ABC-type multidrug transport system ATPase subunit